MMNERKRHTAGDYKPTHPMYATIKDGVDRYRPVIRLLPVRGKMRAYWGWKNETLRR